MRSKSADLYGIAKKESFPQSGKTLPASPHDDQITSFPLRSSFRGFKVAKTMMKTVVVFLFLCLVFLSGCRKEEPAPSPRLQEVQSKSVLIGLIPEHNLFRQVERYDPLANYLSEKTGWKIKLTVLSRYGNIINNFASEDMDGAFFGSFTYALAHTKLKLEVLARPQIGNGESTYHGYILVRKNSGIKTAKEMKGKVFAFVDKATTAGYLLPLVYFKENKIKNYKQYFRETYFAGTHEDVIYDVLEGKADIGAAKNTVFRRLAEKDSRINQELLILYRSPDVPENGLAVRKDLDETVKKTLKDSLLSMSADPKGKGVLKNFGAHQFIETSDSDYNSVYRYARKADLDLAAYDYLNE